MILNKTWLVAFLIITIMFYGCEKNELLNTNSNFNKLKVYDDSTASAENGSLKIDAGPDKIFMVYGSGAPVAFSTGNVFTLDHQSKVIASDFNGEQLWQSSIDMNLDAIDVLALEDGGCVVVSVNYWGNLNHSRMYFFLNRFDGNGNSISTDSVLLPSSFSPDYSFQTAGCSRSTTGNLLLYGSIFDQSDPANATKPFSGEYSLSGGWSWFKSHKFLQSANEASYIFSTIAIEDGYLYAVVAYDIPSGYTPNILLFKSGLSGDSVWTFKHQSTSESFIGNSAIAFDGDAYFGYSFKDNNRFIGYISRIDANGQLLNTIAIDEHSNNYITSIKTTTDGGVSALSNTYGNTFFTFSDPIFSLTNTNHIITTPELTVTSSGLFQSEITDLIPVSCVLPNGSTACFGLMQSKSRTYYKPVLIIIQ